VTAARVTLKLRYTDFQTLTRSRSIPPTSSELEVHRVVVDLHRQARERPLPVRLLGVALSKLRLATEQLALFEHERQRTTAVDRVREKFGYDAVRLATTLFNRRK
jgi:DNA polymerase-4